MKNTPMPHRCHSPWSIDLALEIDRAVPGFCGAFLRASDERRQVIAAYLAAKSSSQEQLVEAADLLLTANHRSILTAAFGQSIPGMRVALRRAGSVTHERRFYLLLRRLLARPRHRQIRPAIERLSSLNTRKLRVLHLLPQSICHAKVVDCIRNVRQALDISIAFRLLVSRGVDEDELASAISRVRDEYGFIKVFETQLLKCRSVQHPIPADEHYRPICSARELREIARKYRNCAGSHIVDLLEEPSRHAFAEVTRGAEGAVVHLVREGTEWRLEELAGPQNGTVGSAMKQCAVRHLREHGVNVISVGRPSSKWSAVRRITEWHDWDDDDDAD